MILGSFQANFWIALLAGLTLILGAAYTLWMYKRVVFGEVANEGVAGLSDVNPREFIVLAALAGGGAPHRALARAASRRDGAVGRKSAGPRGEVEAVNGEGGRRS